MISNSWERISRPEHRISSWLILWLKFCKEKIFGTIEFGLKCIERTQELAKQGIIILVNELEIS